jgi:hypothetical protein
MRTLFTAEHQSAPMTSCAHNFPGLRRAAEWHVRRTTDGSSAALVVLCRATAAVVRLAAPSMLRVAACGFCCIQPGRSAQSEGIR